jgi:hypothetical protein
MMRETPRQPPPSRDSYIAINTVGGVDRRGRARMPQQDGPRRARPALSHEWILSGREPAPCCYRGCRVSARLSGARH